MKKKKKKEEEGRQDERNVALKQEQCPTDFQFIAFLYVDMSTNFVEKSDRTFLKRDKVLIMESKYAATKLRCI